MEKRTMGMTIASLRREKKMTQAELAAKMGVTDKAVSIVLSSMRAIDMNTGFTLLGIGLACAGICLLQKDGKQNGQDQ